ncbi:MAG: restriction endonuclease subunit S, partial [Bacteriovoracaceae bacterium]|nr:restriction endonuclease subunit S [Bacteriovoracaceae bacterium]
LSLDVKISPSRDEQKKIGVLFERFDNLLTLHQSKYDKLINVKKAMLEKMFPKNSANVPEIRFKGFAENWGQSELGQIVKITMGQSPNGENYTDNPEDYILVQGNADMKNEMVVPRVWTKQVTKTADAEDLIMSVRAPVGEVGKTLYDVVIGRGVAAIKGNEFIFQSLKRMNERGYWKRFSAGSTFDSINSNELSKAVILTTKDYEQSKIGSFFKHLDNLISLHLQELEKLKNIKKACLEKMFV